MKAPKSTNVSSYQIPDGVHEAVCTMIIDCGVHESEYMGQKKVQRKVYIRLELPECLIPEGEYKGQRAAIGSRYTFSMYSKATLRQHLEGWRGKVFTDQEADNFDIENVLGQSCMIQTMTNDAGYSNIKAILPSKHKHAPSLTTFFDTEAPAGYSDLPEWIQNKINLPSDESVAMQKEYHDEQAATHQTEQQNDLIIAGQQEAPADLVQNMSDSMDDFEDSDIPF